MVFLGREIGEQRNYSDEVAKQIDDEVRTIIDRGYARAMEVLSAYRDRLDTLAQRLVAEETLDHAEFEKIFADLPDPRKEQGGPTPRPIGVLTPDHRLPADGPAPSGPAPAPSPSPVPA